MKFLIDEDLPRLVTEILIAAGHDAVWVRRMNRGATDEEIVAIAQRESRVIITRDKTSASLSFVRRRKLA